MAPLSPLRGKQSLLPDAEALKAALTGAYTEAARQWPELKVDTAAVALRLQRLLGEGKTTVAGLERLALADLALATCCLQGDPAALAILEQQVFPQVVPAVREVSSEKDFIDECLQQLRERVLVGTAQGPARLGSYEGQGPLVKWLRSVALRIALSSLPPDRDELRLGESLAEVIRASGVDPEWEALAGQLRGELEEALKAAVLALSSEDRLLLRMHLVDGLSIDKLDRLLGAHRSTVARKLKAAREALQSNTRRELSKRLNVLVSRGELNRVALLVRSRLDVSLERLLGTP